MANPLAELHQKFDQSPWHDNIRRELLTSGKLERMVSDGDITGLTSNPTIFEQAIAQSGDYDEALTLLARAGKSPEEIFDALSTEDIQKACDVFRPVYERTKGRDGFVSIEVAPNLAHDTESTVREAHRLWKHIGRENLMVKIPATRAGVPAIERCIAEGLNINVTLIFSLQRYDEVMDAYIRGLARRHEEKKPLGHISSVASFFVSRVDSAVDKLLEQKLQSGSASQKDLYEGLLGQAAIANARLAYAAYQKKFTSPAFAPLERAGARRQRPLWASTSTKNPRYPDVYYVEALIGPETVNTLPPATLVAYKDHGKPARRLDTGLAEAEQTMAKLAQAGVNMGEIIQKLEDEGVASFTKSYDSLMAVVRSRCEAARAGTLKTARAG